MTMISAKNVTGTTAPMEPKGAEFAKEYGDGCEVFGGWKFDISYSELHGPFVKKLSAAAEKWSDARVKIAVEEAVKKYHGLNEALLDNQKVQQDLIKTLHDRLTALKEAGSRVWEEAAKIAEAERVEEMDATDVAYNTAIRHVAEALRSKAASS